MCGIVGIFQKNVNNYLKISNAINVINHRGPDAHNSIKKKVGFF